VEVMAAACSGAVCRPMEETKGRRWSKGKFAKRGKG